MPRLSVQALLFAARPALGLALLLGLGCGAAQAQYKWKDSRGQLHVSDLPPPADIPERQVLQRPAAARAGAGTAGAAARPVADARPGNPPSPRAGETPSNAAAPEDPELARRRLKAEAERQAQAQAEALRQAGLRAQNCDRARQHLAQLQSGQRLQRISASGERVPVDDATRESEAALARQVLASDCR